MRSVPSDCRTPADPKRFARSFNVSETIDRGDGIKIATAGRCIHIAKRGRKQQLGIYARSGARSLLASIDVVTRDIGCRVDGPGKIEVTGRSADGRNKGDD